MAHRVVYAHFNGSLSASIDINHDNGLKDDNRPSNLLKSDPTDNLKHAHRYGLKDQYGQKNPAHKLTDNEVAQIRLAYQRGGYTMAALARRFSVAFQTISEIVRGFSRPKQGGPIASHDLRHNACEKDPATGRFLKRVREFPR